MSTTGEDERPGPSTTASPPGPSIPSHEGVQPTSVAPTPGSVEGPLAGSSATAAAVPTEGPSAGAEVINPVVAATVRENTILLVKLKYTFA